MVLSVSRSRPEMGPVEIGMAGPRHRTATFKAMGTICRFTVETESPTAADEFRARAVAWVDRFEATFSRFLPDSLLSRINAAAGHEAVALGREEAELFTLCDRLFWQTDGIFDPTSLSLTRLWTEAGRRGSLPTTEEIGRCRALMGWDRVRWTGDSIFLLEEGMELDLGGIGKEYAVDRIVEMGRDFGYPSMLVDFGQDVRAYGQAPQGGPWRIGLEHPDRPGHSWMGLAIQDRAVATSGDYQRYITIGGTRYPHVIDPRTGMPISGETRAVTAVSASCTEAGVLAKSILILGHDEGQRLIRKFPLNDVSIWSQSGIFQTQGLARYTISKRGDES